MTDAPPCCPRCGSPFPVDAPEGLCPRCLAAINLDSASLFTGEGASLPPPPIEEIAPHFPQLDILSCLGRGGMGVVYQARQKSLDRLVALKLLAPEREKDPQFSDRFAREAQALARMSHPHIVTVHDFGQAGGFFFLLMEFVDGVNLRQLLQAHKLTPEQALAIVPPLCDTLQYAHDRGIVHRDIKPENLLMDKAGRVKVADFGLAKMLGTPTDADESPVGTPRYMAPEQLADPAQVDNRADIYSLGVVLYEMLTGELPGTRLEAPSRKVQIDVRLDEIVLRALEKSPELRFQQASILKTAVETIASDPAPLDVEPVTSNESPRKSGFRSPLQQQNWKHMSASEKREMTLRGLMFTVWNVATWFVPIFIVLRRQDSARWFYAALVLAGGLAAFPIWWKILREGECSTAWARQHGWTPERLREAARAMTAPLWVRLAGAAVLFGVLLPLNFSIIPGAGWPKPVTKTVSFILSFGLSFLYVFLVQRVRKMPGGGTKNISPANEATAKRSSLSLPTLALGVVALGLAIFAAWTFPQFPARLASHFDLEGNANGWMTRAHYFLLLGGLPVFLTAMFWLIARQASRFPTLLNIPNRDYWLAPERRAEIFHVLLGQLLWLDTLLLIFFGILHALVLQAQRSSPSHLPTGALLGLVIAFFTVLIIWLANFLMRLADPCHHLDSQPAKRTANGRRALVVGACLVVGLLAAAIWFWNSSTDKLAGRVAEMNRQQIERQLTKTRQRFGNAQPPTLEPALAAWHRSDEAAAISLLLRVDWEARPLFSPTSILSLSEDEFGALPVAERQEKAVQLNARLSELQKLLAALEHAGFDAAAKQDVAQARACFEALQRCGRALDDPVYTLIVRLLGQATEKRARTALAKWPDIGQTRRVSQEQLADLELADIRLSARCGPKHPKRIESARRLAAFDQQHPGLRDADYRFMLGERRAQLLVEQEKLSARYAPKHPKQIELQYVLAALDQLREKYLSTDAENPTPTPRDDPNTPGPWMHRRRW